jgi:uncharacterized protein
MPDVAYLDSSAIVKTVVREPESSALRRVLRGFRVHASAALARTEVLRAVRRAEPRAVPRVREALGKLLLVELDEALLDAAGMLEPSALRTLDAIHLSAAHALAAELGALITYDERMARAAADLGFPVRAPA